MSLLIYLKCNIFLGSTETEWSIPQAGLVWADCLLRHFRIPRTEPFDSDSNNSANTYDSSSSSSSSSSDTDSSDTDSSDGVVLVTIGGGHYVPKMNDAVSSLFLASYYLCCFHVAALFVFASMFMLHVMC